MVKKQNLQLFSLSGLLFQSLVEQMTSCRGTVASATLCIVNMITLLFGVSIILKGFQAYEQIYKSTSTSQSDLTVSSSSPMISTSLIFGICTWHTGSIIIGVIGAGIFLLATLGICVALCNDSWSSTVITNLYIYLLVILFWVMLIGNVCFWFFTDTIVRQTSGYFHQLVVNSSINSDAANIIQRWQSWTYCCGEHSFMDWQNLTWTHNQTKFMNEPSYHGEDGKMVRFPASCCNQKWSFSVIESDNLNKTNIIDLTTDITSNRIISETITSFSSITTDGQCEGSQVIYFDGCFSETQVSRYHLFGQIVFLLVLMFKVLLIVLTCCLDNDRKLETSKLINIQYVAHLQFCSSINGLHGSGYNGINYYKSNNISNQTIMTHGDNHSSYHAP